MSPGEFVSRYLYIRAPRLARRRMTTEEFEEWLDVKFDPWLDFGIIVGVTILFIVLALNVRVCLDIYEAAGPRFSGADGWCN